MADQKTEDTKSPLQRRGARPFAGPAGAARPFLRPVATPQRATAAPFVPPVVPGKPALGTAAPAAKAPTPVATQPVPEAVPQTVAPADADVVPRTRPVTSEMIALDAFDAFDTVWRTHEQPVAAPEPQATTSPLDESSLGSGTDTHQVWAEDITAAAGDVMAGELDAPPAPAAEPAYSTPAGAIPAWLEDDNPITPAADATPPVAAHHLSSDSVEAPEASPAWPIAEHDASYSLSEWTDTHSIPPADAIQPATTEPPYAGLVEPSLGEALQESAALVPESVADAPNERPRFELVSESQETEALPTAIPDSRTIRDMRVASALDRLAERIRSGEIDVSSIAPDAPDAAILASVLAALLGGSSSR